MIRPPTGGDLLDLRELWAYRELLGFLALRDIRIRYKQTVVGVLWVVLQPLAMIAVLAVFFGRLARVPSDGFPYALFVLAGLIPWQLFARVLDSTSDSLLRDQGLVSKVYFPRLVIPLSAALSAMLDFAISLLVLAGVMVLFRVTPSPALLMLPIFLLLLMVTVLGVGFWFAALNVEFRDVKHLVPFLTQVWFFLTPVVYPATLVPERFQVAYAINPMVGVIEGFRWALLGAQPPALLATLVSALIAIALLVSGVTWFHSRERLFSDHI